MSIQDLDSRFKIVNDDGTPTEYFLRLIRDRGKSQSETEAMLAEASAWEVQGGVGIDGGGPVSAGVTLDLNASINDLNDVDTATTPPTDGQAIVWNETDSEWVPGDVAGGGGALELIEEFVSTGAQTSHTFSSIPSNYSTIRLEWTARGTTAATLSVLDVELNGDTGNNYDAQTATANNATAGASAAVAAKAQLLIPAASAVTGSAGTGCLDFPDYTNTVFHKNILGLYTYKTTNTAAGLFNRRFSAWWRNTSAVTAIKVIIDAGAFVAGSKIRLYGIT